MPVKKASAKKARVLKSKKSKKPVRSGLGICTTCGAAKMSAMAACTSCEPTKPMDPVPTPPAAPEPLPDTEAPGPEMHPDDTCENCNHLPVHTNAVLGMLIAVIAVLSITVLASVMVISSQAFQIDVFNSNGSFIKSVVRK